MDRYEFSKLELYCYSYSTPNCPVLLQKQPHICGLYHQVQSVIVNTFFSSTLVLLFFRIHFLKKPKYMFC